MPPVENIDALLRESASALEKAQTLRAELRRRRPPDRESLLREAVQLLSTLTRDLGRYNGWSKFYALEGNEYRALDARRMSRALQAERRKLRKMLARPARRSIE